MKLRINETLLIGDPNTGAEIEIETKGRIFDIQIINEHLTYNGLNFGERPTQVNFITTSADTYKTWEILGTIGIDTGQAGIWSSDASEDSTWTELEDGFVSNLDGEFVDGLVVQAGLGDGEYNVYVKRNENNEITDFVIDFREEIEIER